MYSIKLLICDKSSWLKFCIFDLSVYLLCPNDLPHRLFLSSLSMAFLTSSPRNSSGDLPKASAYYSEGIIRNAFNHSSFISVNSGHGFSGFLYAISSIVIPSDSLRSLSLLATTNILHLLFLIVVTLHYQKCFKIATVLQVINTIKKSTIKYAKLSLTSW